MKKQAFGWLLLSLAAAAASGQLRPVTVDDEMKFRAMVDVRIAPDGDSVAYVVSTPSVSKNEHEASLYVVAASGGTPTLLAQTLKIFNAPTPQPRLRWSPDGSALSLLAFAGEKPQAFAIPLAGGAPRQLTDAPEGVTGFEWSPDGKTIAYLTRDPATPEETRQRQDKSFVIHADAPERATRLAARPAEGGPARTLTPASQYVDSFSWLPDGREIAYAAAPRSGFTAPYETRIYAVPAGGGARPERSWIGRE
jgi:dipeptidyl aminopeptidase/acylaminoacyl peptidase